MKTNAFFYGDPIDIEHKLDPHPYFWIIKHPLPPPRRLASAKTGKWQKDALAVACSACSKVITDTCLCFARFDIRRNVPQ